LAEELVKLNVLKKNIYVLENKKTYDLGKFTIKAIDTCHDVPNTSYLINFKPITLYYATDTSKLDYLNCLRGLNYYFVENNYSDEELEQRIKEKEEKGEYTYEYRVKNTHMSSDETNKFLMEMMSENSKSVYCHQHQSKFNFEYEEVKNEK